MNKIIRRTSKENADLFKRIIDLAITIADKYKDNHAYEAALEGLYVGLNLYSQKQPSDNLDLYLYWFIKTSIEFKLGFKTKDTKLWESKRIGGETAKS